MLVLDDMPLPEPATSQARVRIHAAGVNPVETYIRSGSYARLPELPYTPGFDGAGVIEALGADVEGWQIGQRVWLSGSITGTYAEQAICDISHLHPLPEGISYQQGAALGIPATTAHLALFHRGVAHAGETVLIRGATGSVGTTAVQLAKAAKLRVLATGGTPEGREMVHALGADVVFDHADPSLPSAILDATEGHGVNLIVEMLANINLGSDLPLLSTDGRVIVVGSCGMVEILPRDLMTHNADIRGLMLFSTPSAVVLEARAAINLSLEDGSLKPVVGKEFALAEAGAAHQAISDGGAKGKIVLVS